MPATQVNRVALPDFEVVYLADPEGTLQATYDLYTNTSYVSVAGDSAGNILVGSGDSGELIKLAKDGSEIWRLTGISFGGSVVISVEALAVTDNDAIYAACVNDDSLFRFASDGTQEIAFGIDYPPHDIALFSNGDIAVAQNFGVVRRFDGNGNQVWENTGLGDHVRGIAVDANDNVYAGGQDNNLYKLNSSGVIQWSNSMGSWVLAVDVADDGFIYATISDALWKWDDQGNKQWEDAITGAGQCVLVLPTGNILSSDHGGSTVIDKPDKTELTSTSAYQGYDAANVTFTQFTDFWTGEHGCREIIPG